MGKTCKRCSVELRRTKADICYHCELEENSEMREYHREQQLANKKSDLRKWYKWICKNDLYEKSVRVTGIVDFYTAWSLEDRLVFSITPTYPIGDRSIKPRPHGLLNYGDYHMVDGYYRVRTDNCYYPLCGIAGIPNERKSGASTDFQRWLGKGWQKKQEIKIEQKRLKFEAQQEKLIEKMKKDREQAMEGLREWEAKRAMRGRNYTSTASTLKFFQMVGGASQISEALTNKQQIA
jgi:hypothetical protein